MDNEMKMPLSGVKVVELATVVAAPAASRMLCAYGADVIKIETLAGDELRRAGDFEQVPYEDYKNPLFTVYNSNKRTVSINIKSPEGKKAVLQLLSNADVFITNIREASLKRLGLDYEAIKDTFQKLIYVHFTGFGPKGPAANNPGFDSTAFWMRSGAMADWQVKGSFPFVPGYAFGDTATSSVLLSGILMALYARTNTGAGTKVETSLFASGIWCNSVDIVGTQFENKHPNPDPLRPCDPFDTTYECSDGKWIGIYTNEYERDKEKFAKLFGIDDILDDRRYDTLETLRATDAVAEGVKRLSEIFKTKSSEQWRELLSAESISCEVMRCSCEVSCDEQAIENHYLEKIEFKDGLDVMMPCPPIHFSNYRRREYEPTGGIGENTDEIFAELGYSENEIRAMRESGAIK